MDFFFNDVKYHVESYGEGKPILMLHGFTGRADSFQFFSEKARDRKVIAPDIIGHGKTEVSNDVSHYNIVEQAAMLAQLLEQIELTKIDVHGYSMGGRLAITFAVLYPEKVNSLILESTTPGIQSSADRDLRIQNDKKIATMIADKGIGSFVDYWESIPLFASQTKLSECKRVQIRKQRMQNNPQGLINSLVGMGTGAQPNWWNDIGNLKMPVLLLTGSFDEKFCRIAEEIVKIVHQAKHKTIEESGHTIHVEKPEQFVSAVEQFLLETSTC